MHTPVRREKKKEGVTRLLRQPIGRQKAGFGGSFEKPAKGATRGRDSALQLGGKRRSKGIAA